MYKENPLIPYFRGAVEEVSYAVAAAEVIKYLKTLRDSDQNVADVNENEAAVDNMRWRKKAIEGARRYQEIIVTLEEGDPTLAIAFLETRIAQDMNFLLSVDMNDIKNSFAIAALLSVHNNLSYRKAILEAAKAAARRVAQELFTE